MKSIRPRRCWRPLRLPPAARLPRSKSKTCPSTAGITWTCLQLVPGVSLNRQNDPAGDNSTPILGERGGNALYLIDGMPNKDNFNGGPSAQFNQDSILEFQVVTGGYKAEFGHASGGIINVVTRGGTNNWHGGVSVFAATAYSIRTTFLTPAGRALPEPLGSHRLPWRAHYER